MSTTRSALGLLDRRLLFVTGKGGVGKTSVASALGHLAASHGKRTLVCEVDSKGDLADFFGVGPLSFDPTEVRPNLAAMAMDTEASLKEYLRLQLKVPMLAKVGPLARDLRLHRQRRTRGQGDPDGRQAHLRGA